MRYQGVCIVSALMILIMSVFLVFASGYLYDEQDTKVVKQRVEEKVVSFEGQKQERQYYEKDCCETEEYVRYHEEAERVERKEWRFFNYEPECCQEKDLFINQRRPGKERVERKEWRFFNYEPKCC